MDKNKELIKIKNGLPSYTKEDLLMMKDFKEELIKHLLEYQKRLEISLYLRNKQATFNGLEDKAEKNKQFILFFGEEIDKLLNENQEKESDRVSLFNFYYLCLFCRENKVNLGEVISGLRGKGFLSLEKKLGISIIEDDVNDVKKIKFIDFSLLHDEKKEKHNEIIINEINLMHFPFNLFFLKSFNFKIEAKEIISCFDNIKEPYYSKIFFEQSENNLEEKIINSIFFICKNEEQEKLLKLVEKRNYFFKNFNYKLIKKTTEKLLLKELKETNLICENVINVWNNIVDENRIFKKELINFWSEQFNNLSDKHKYNFVKGLTFSVFSSEEIENIKSEKNMGHVYLLNLIENVKSERKISLTEEFMKRWIKHGYDLTEILGGTSSSMDFVFNLDLYKKASGNYLKDCIEWFFNNCGKEKFEEKLFTTIKSGHFNQKDASDFRWNIFWSALKDNGVDLSFVYEKNLLSQIPVDKQGVFEKAAIEKRVDYIENKDKNVKNSEVKPHRF